MAGDVTSEVTALINREGGLMPPVSEAQRKWAFANKDKKTREGKAAAEFAKADSGGKLPKKAKPSGNALRDMAMKGHK
jgi:hypothetical protein